MDDFFKQFRENLNRRPAPDFKEGDWLAFQKRLDPPPPKQVPTPLFWWVFLPVLMASLAANGLLFQTIRQHRILEKTLEIHRDTVFLSRLIYQTDTVFQTRIIRQTIFCNHEEEACPTIAPMGTSPTAEKRQLTSAVFPQDTAYQTTNSLAEPPTSAAPLMTGAAKMAAPDTTEFSDEGKISGFAQKVVPDTTGSVLKNKPDSTALVATILKDSLRATPVFLEKKGDGSLALQIQTPENKKTRKSLYDQLTILRPKYFEVGVSSGAILPVGGAANWQIGPSVNLQAVAGFSKSLRLQLEGGFSRLDFNAPSVRAGFGAPDVAPPDDDFRLVSVEGSWSNVQYYVAMQWLFRNGKKWRPLLGLGFGSAWRQPFQAAYDFKNEATGVEWIKELDIPGNTSPFAFGLVTVGVERSIFKKWSGLLRANGRLQLGSEIAAPPSTLDVQAGLKYSF